MVCTRLLVRTRRIDRGYPLDVTIDVSWEMCVTGWEPYDLHDLAIVSRIGSLDYTIYQQILNNTWYSITADIYRIYWQTI